MRRTFVSLVALAGIAATQSIASAQTGNVDANIIEDCTLGYATNMDPVGSPGDPLAVPPIPAVPPFLWMMTAGVTNQASTAGVSTKVLVLCNTNYHADVEDFAATGQLTATNTGTALDGKLLVNPLRIEGVLAAVSGFLTAPVAGIVQGTYDTDGVDDEHPLDFYQDVDSSLDPVLPAGSYNMTLVFTLFTDPIT